MKLVWIGTAHLSDATCEWQVSDGPVGKRSASTDFDDAGEALAWARDHADGVVLEDDFTLGAVERCVDCADELVPGTHYPTQGDRWGIATRCARCRRYDNHADAAEAVAARLGRISGRLPDGNHVVLDDRGRPLPYATARFVESLARGMPRAWIDGRLHVAVNVPGQPAPGVPSIVAISAHHPTMGTEELGFGYYDDRTGVLLTEDPDCEMATDDGSEPWTALQPLADAITAHLEGDHS